VVLGSRSLRKEAAMDSKPAVRLWKADELNYVSLGTGDMVFSNPIEPEIGRYHAGYLDFHGGTLNWTENGEEFIWVLSGRVEVTHGDDVYETGPGDLIFMKHGITLSMTGSDDARIAYISHLFCE
jgi:ethanolamine utilization protein EutQ (cupin superfamily)